MSTAERSESVVTPPMHGYRGEAAGTGRGRSPTSLTVAISRQVGARGGSIAQRVGAALGWQVYTRELLEYMANDEIARAQLVAELPDGSAEWVDARMEELRFGPHADMGELPRLMLMLAARGEVVIVGRGAGFLLPEATTLHVRVVAPEPARVGYIEQWLRLSREDAADQVRQRELKRSDFLGTTYGESCSDPVAFDLLLNSDRLGADACVGLIADAARHKQASLSGHGAEPATDE